MNSFELELVEKLTDLKENHFAVGVKAEFEDEGASTEDLLLLKQIADKAGLELSLKIGGCGAIKDLLEAKNVGAQNIIAPMIESVYALKKYCRAVNSVFSDEERKKFKFYINIETKNGLEYIDEILNSGFLAYINGIILGRTDMAESMDMSSADADSDTIFQIAQRISAMAYEQRKEFILGGSISTLSLPFLKKLPEKMLNKYETRKIIFDARNALNADNTEEGIVKALEFELMWIKNRKNRNQKADYERISILESRLLCESR